MCTPLLPSTSSVMCKSAATLASIYASSRVKCFSVTKKSIISRSAQRGAGIQIVVEAHGHVVRGRFGARPFQVHVLAHDELKRADERSFERGDVHFAVALPGVAVAHFKERAGRVHRNVERRAGDEVLVVHVAAP